MIQIALTALTIFIGIFAWLANFAIKEYPVFKQLKLPSIIFNVGGKYLILLAAWNLSANNVYSKLLPYIPAEKIEEVKSTITFMTSENEFLYFIIALWVFLWFCAFSISEVAKSIHDARTKVKSENGQTDK